MAFPSTLSSFTRPNATDRLNNLSHSALHNTVSSALGQVEAVIGVDGTSSVVGTMMYDLRSPASPGGGHIQGAAFGGTGQTNFTKGDMLIGQSASVLSKLTVGSNGTFLTADSTQSVGIKWASVSNVGELGGSSYVAQNGGTTVTLSHTIGTNDKLLVVFVNNDQVVGGVTYGGVAMTAGETTSTLNSMYYMINPSIGTANIVVSIASGGNSNVIGVSFSGFVSVTALDTHVYSTASSTTLTKSSTSIVPTFGVFGFFALETGATSPFISNGQVRKIVVSGARNYNAIVGSFVYGTSVTATFASSVNIYGVLGSFTFT